MNKQEKLIAVLLGLLLVAWLFYGQRQAVQHTRQAAQSKTLESPSTATAAPAMPASTTLAPAPTNSPSGQAAAASETVLPVPSTPEEVAELKTDDIALTISSHGAVIKRAVLSRYATLPGKPGEKNPPVTFDFSADPGLELTGLPGLPPNASYHLERDSAGRSVTLTAVTPQGLSVVRRIEVLKDYRVKVSDTVKNASDSVVVLGTNDVCLGAMVKGASKNEMLSIDSLPAAAEAKTRHWGSEKATRQYLAGGTASGFGCGGAPSAVGMPESVPYSVSEPQAWVALKSRFFVAALRSSEPNSGFTFRAVRDTSKPVYALSNVSARLHYPGRVLGQGESMTREYTLFIGPKMLSLLQEAGNGLDAVMEFGTFAWFCKLLVPTLNFFHRLIPNYGVAIILLTFLVRIIFWPLTHKSTISMKKMQELQPKLKELQAKFKDNPQKMQQETWALYKENKVNPMSSCLPMLVQIPVFIALFTVLRSAVELRYAPFLWVSDLSEPENLLAGLLPIPLNILPFLMAGTMALQSYLTPSAGDPQQQKMMMVMMPIMMLVMFYGFPSALSLYWTVSQVISIVQMLMMRHKYTVAHGGPGGGTTVEPPLTRQQRRHAVG